MSNHVPLAIYALDDGRPVKLPGISGARTPEDAAAFRSDVEQRLTAELADAASTCTTVLFSNEHLQSRLRHPGELLRLRALLERFSSDIGIIVYLRRQDRVANSAHSTRIVSGYTNYEYDDATREGSIHSYYFRYGVMLENYASVFGKDRMDVRLYDEHYKHGDGLIRDFASAIGLGEFSDVRDDYPLANQSLSAAAQRFVTRLNESVPAATPGIQPARHAILTMVRKTYPGTRRVFSRTTARLFMDRFASHNERIRKDYFASRPGPLFDDDYCEYPEALSDADIDFTRPLELASAILRDSAADDAADEAGQQRRKAQLVRLQAMLPPV
jgi:hypothetical protein